MRHIISILLLAVSAFSGYYLGRSSGDAQPSPVWDCYKALWGDVNAMRSHGLEGMSAPEVHAYCIEMIGRGEPSLMVLSSTYSDPASYVAAPECPPCVCADLDDDEGCLDNSFIHDEISK